MSTAVDPTQPQDSNTKSEWYIEHGMSIFTFFAGILVAVIVNAFFLGGAWTKLTYIESTSTKTQTDLSALSDKIGDVELAVAKLPTTESVSKVADAVAKNTNEISGMNSTLQSLKDLPESVSKYSKEVAAINTKIDGLPQYGPLAKSVEQVAEKVDSVSKSQESLLKKIETMGGAQVASASVLNVRVRLEPSMKQKSRTIKEGVVNVFRLPVQEGYHVLEAGEIRFERIDQTTLSSIAKLENDASVVLEITTQKEMVSDLPTVIVSLRVRPL